MKRCFFVFCGFVLSSVLIVSSSIVLAQSKVVYIGDSHTTGPFGDSFARELALAFREPVNRYGVSSATVSGWMKNIRTFRVDYKTSKVSASGEELDVVEKKGRVPSTFKNFPELMEEKSDVVVIELGTNDISIYCSSPETLSAQVVKMLSKVKGRKCVWVGPPSFTVKADVITPGCDGNHRKYHQAVEDLKDQVKELGCFYVDSREIRLPMAIEAGKSFNPKSFHECTTISLQPLYPDRKDHVHFDEDRGSYWGKCAGLAVKEALQAVPSPIHDLGIPTDGEALKSTKTLQ